jgi:hypothetical protein
MYGNLPLQQAYPKSSHIRLLITRLIGLGMCEAHEFCHHAFIPFPHLFQPLVVVLLVATANLPRCLTWAALKAILPLVY